MMDDQQLPPPASTLLDDPVPAAPAVDDVPAIAQVPVVDDTPPVPPAPPAEPPAPAEVPDRAHTAAELAKDPALLEARRQRAQEAWQRVVDAHANKTQLSARVTTAVKGGLLVDAGGIRGFLPASQVRLADGAALESLVKTTMNVRVLDVDTARRRIVVSQRRAADDDRRAKRGELLASLSVGQTREGVVARLTDFGAFIDLGGIDGLVPMRELAFERVEKVSDVLTVGDPITVQVLRIDEGGKKISLSRRNALPDPWREHGDRVRQGAIVEGTVVAREPRLQVEIAPGIVGTVRESDANPLDYEIGEAMEVRVAYVDRRTRRITLSTPQQMTHLPTSSGFAPLGVELGRRT
jgi:ribosomal protein S1